MKTLGIVVAIAVFSVGAIFSGYVYLSSALGLVGSGSVGVFHSETDSDNSTGNDIYWLSLPGIHGHAIENLVAKP